jgi:hypothetical protein
VSRFINPILVALEFRIQYWRSPKTYQSFELAIQVATFYNLDRYRRHGFWCCRTTQLGGLFSTTHGICRPIDTLHSLQYKRIQSYCPPLPLRFWQSCWSITRCVVSSPVDPDATVGVVTASLKGNVNWQEKPEVRNLSYPSYLFIYILTLIFSREPLFLGSFKLYNLINWLHQ